jgi:rod shape-determining protein MreD
MNRAHVGLFWLPLSAALAVILGLVPLPDPAAPLRPYFLALVLVYWLLETPDKVGMGTAFGLGLIGDLAFGTLIGEQALRLTVLAWLVQRFRTRMRFFPLWQQSVVVFALLMNDRALAAVVHIAIGESLPHWTFWLSPLLALPLWPWLVVMFDTLRMRARERRR